MIDRTLTDITRDDIEALVRYGRSEGRTLDFKEAFPAADHKGTRDFLADVTAFANTDGGDIVIGVAEDGNGVASDIPGAASQPRCRRTVDRHGHRERHSRLSGSAVQP